MWLASWFKNRKQAGKPSNILPNPRLVVGYEVKRCSRCPWSFHMKIRLENPKRSVHISFYIDETNKSYYIWRLKIIDPKNRCREDETGPMWSKFLVPKLDPASGRRFRLAPYLGVDTFASSNISKSTACEVIPCEGIWTCDHFTSSAPICVYVNVKCMFSSF